MECALQQAALDGAGDVIKFNFPPGDSGFGGTPVVCTFTRGFTLRTGITIDGYSQPGASVNSNPFGQPDNAALRIRFDGGALDIRASQVTVDGISVTHTPGSVTAIAVNCACSNEAIRGNFVGEMPDGTAAG